MCISSHIPDECALVRGPRVFRFSCQWDVGMDWLDRATRVLRWEGFAIKTLELFEKRRRNVTAWLKHSRWALGHQPLRPHDFGIQETHRRQYRQILWGGRGDDGGSSAGLASAAGDADVQYQ